MDIVKLARGRGMAVIRPHCDCRATIDSVRVGACQRVCHTLLRFRCQLAVCMSELLARKWFVAEKADVPINI